MLVKHPYISHFPIFLSFFSLNLLYIIRLIHILKSVALVQMPVQVFHLYEVQETTN